MMDFSPKMLGKRTFWVVDKTREERTIYRAPGGITVDTREVVPVDKYDMIAKIMDQAAKDLWEGWSVEATPLSPDPLGMCGYLIEDDPDVPGEVAHGYFLHCVHAAASGLDVRVDSIVTGAR